MERLADLRLMAQVAAAWLLLGSAVGSRTAPSPSSSSSSGGGGGRTLCVIATNEASRSEGEPCHFDFFSTTALSDEGGWFMATCAETQVKCAG
jgi:hypothetical protein